MPTKLQNNEDLLIGVVSDTHGRLQTSAVKALEGVDLIIHAGDIDTPGILNKLQTIAPVVAVRGNMDRGAWAQNLSETEMVEIEKVRIYVLHDIENLSLAPAAAGMNVFISGHSHRPSVKKQGGILYINPGSTARPRHNNTPSLALLRLTKEEFPNVRIIAL
jgi:putative phosphoesterase